MPRFNNIPALSMLGAFAICFSQTLCLPFAYSQSKTAPLAISPAARCGRGLEKAKERIFAADTQGWAEYPDMKHVPRMDVHGSQLRAEPVFAVKSSAAGRHYVRSVQYGAGSATFQGSCFDESGKLVFVQYQMRTGDGWGYEDVRKFNPQGKQTSQDVRFFDTLKNTAIPRPQDADKRQPFTTPNIYQTFDSLPFIAALKKQGAHAPQK
jgi:hypothetical protein